MRTIAVLCAATNSIYKTLPGLEVYDIKRDARTFQGGMPVVAHPPCRGWSAYCSHQAHATEEEKQLGVWCAEQVRQWGGVLEQPAHSRLFQAAGLPLPGQSSPCGGFTLDIEQAWWGYPMKKRTWLFFAGIAQFDLAVPYRPHDSRSGEGDRRRQQRMSKNQRAATYPALAKWLVAAARMVRA